MDNNRLYSNAIPRRISDTVFDNIKLNTFLAPATSPKDIKEEKKRDKGKFGTAGKKAGAKLRHKLGKNKASEDQSDGLKSTSPTTSYLPPSPTDDEIDDQGMKPPKLVYNITTSFDNMENLHI